MAESPMVLLSGHAPLAQMGRGAFQEMLQIQHDGAERTIGCELRLSRYDKVAEALGGHGEFVEHADDLEPALDRAIKSGLPACVNVAIEGVAAPTYRSSPAGH